MSLDGGDCISYQQPTHTHNSLFLSFSLSYSPSATNFFSFFRVNFVLLILFYLSPLFCSSPLASPGFFHVFQLAVLSLAIFLSLLLLDKFICNRMKASAALTWFRSANHLTKTRSTRTQTFSSPAWLVYSMFS